MNIEIKNIHAIQSLVEHHCEKVISISGKADNSKAKEILELAHKKNIKINIKGTKKHVIKEKFVGINIRINFALY